MVNKIGSCKRKLENGTGVSGKANRKKIHLTNIRHFLPYPTFPRRLEESASGLIDVSASPGVQKPLPTIPNVPPRFTPPLSDAAL